MNEELVPFTFKERLLFPKNPWLCIYSIAFFSLGEKSYKFEEFLPIHETIMNTLEQGTFADYMEAFKTFDREGQGYISGAELRHLLSSLGKHLFSSRLFFVLISNCSSIFLVNL